MPPPETYRHGGPVTGIRARRWFAVGVHVFMMNTMN
ncbi:hypothetical protein A2U01_0029696, partial [Trifolium medium]|nr:hypothetical protein [Trifolium medium]